MNGSEWGLKMQSDIYYSKHMVKLQQQLLTIGAILLIMIFDLRSS